MGSMLAGGSILAAFFGGAVALFSPCCIVFLLPSYLAAAVKNRRWHILPLTFLFALGLGVVLVPMTLGIALVASTLSRFHTAFYLAGGIMLLVLAGLSFTRSPDVDRADSAGMLALGIFSGVASSCCAPVLAGVATLSALSSSLAGSVTLGMAYVFGMTFPLFVMALAWDRFDLGERKLFESRVVKLRIAGRRIVTNTANIAVAVAFTLMGALVITLGITGETTAAPDAQLAMGRWLSRTFDALLRRLDPVPEPVLGLLLLAVAGSFVYAAIRPQERSTSGSSCHEHVTTAQPQDEDLTS